MKKRETPQEKMDRQIQETRRNYGGRMGYSHNRRNSIADFEDKVAADKAKREREEAAKAEATEKPATPETPPDSES